MSYLASQQIPIYIYILSIQDRLTRYNEIYQGIPLQNETSNSIIDGLKKNYIYIFGAPKTILSDQGQNFQSELMNQFEDAHRIQHVKKQLSILNPTVTLRECFPL